MDFSGSSEEQPINLCDKVAPAHVTPSYQSDSCSADGLRSRAKYGTKSTAEVSWGDASAGGGKGAVQSRHIPSPEIQVARDKPWPPFIEFGQL